MPLHPINAPLPTTSYTSHSKSHKQACGNAHVRARAHTDDHARTCACSAAPTHPTLHSSSRTHARTKHSTLRRVAWPDWPGRHRHTFDLCTFAQFKPIVEPAVLKVTTDECCTPMSHGHPHCVCSTAGVRCVSHGALRTTSHTKVKRVEPAGVGSGRLGSGRVGQGRVGWGRAG